MVPLGIRQARYFGRVKTRFQAFMAATVANLTLIGGLLGSETRGPRPCPSLFWLPLPLPGPLTAGDGPPTSVARTRRAAPDPRIPRAAVRVLGLSSHGFRPDL